MTDTTPAWQAEYDSIMAVRHHDDINDVMMRVHHLRTQHPNVRDIEFLYAGILTQKNQINQAIEIFKQLPQPDAEALSRIGMLYYQLNDLKTALDYLEQAKQLAPNDISILINYGFLLQTNGNVNTARTYFERVLELEPNHQDALFRLAWIEAHDGQFQRALSFYERIPNHVIAQGTALFYRHYMMPHRPDQITIAAKKVGQTYSRRHAYYYPNIAKADPARLPNKPLKIGLMSADLKNHVVGFFIESLLSGKATKQYEWFAYYNHTAEDSTSRHLKTKFKAWHEIKYWASERVIEQIRADGVDVLIDLSGYTNGGRLEVFTAQAAPVQVAWLGYFGTTGLPEMQAIIADPYCVPKHEEFLYTEKVYRMPHTRLCMTAPSATEVGRVVTGTLGQSQMTSISAQPQIHLPIETTPALKNGYITFGCYQNLLKINDEVLKTWAKIAQRLPESRWYFQNSRLKKGSADLKKFQDKLQQFNFDLNKITFNDHMGRRDYLLNYNQIDIILDTFPYNGGTTTAEALWMATPTITWTMAGMIARQGEQMMCAAGLPEWVCHSETEYIDKAVFWGQPENFNKLNELHMNMREQVSKSPLFDTEQFATDWCHLIRQIWRDFCVDKQSKMGLQIDCKPILVNVQRHKPTGSLK